MSNKLRGFTLIELVLVTLIIGILVIAAVPFFLDLTKQAQVAVARANVMAIHGAFKIQLGESIIRNAGASNSVVIFDIPTIQSWFEGGLPMNPLTNSKAGGTIRSSGPTGNIPLNCPNLFVNRCTSGFGGYFTFLDYSNFRPYIYACPDSVETCEEFEMLNWLN